MSIRVAVLLSLLALLCLATPLRAAADEAPPGELATLELEEIDGLEEELDAEEECEEVEEGVEECEVGEAEDRAADARAVEECLLRSANARVVAGPERRQLKLTLGYTAHEPADATIVLRDGGQQLGSVQRHLGRSGVVRLTRNLSAGQAEKLDAGDRIAVLLRLAGAPKSCKRVGDLSPRLVLQQ